MTKKKLCIAGKGEVACRALRYVIDEMGLGKSDIVVIPTKSDAGVPSWQPSLRLLARKSQIDIVSLEELYNCEELVFVSLEFDRIIRTARFKSSHLYNIHFSLLPAYRGIGMAKHPILNGEEKSGVTLHYIDDGIDTGDIIAQREFCIAQEWDCRALYMKFNDEAFQLFKSWIPRLLDDTPPPAIRQNPLGASYYSRSDTPYNVENYDSYFQKTAWQATSALRAATFWEYQLPRVDGRRVLRSSTLNIRSKHSPGHVERISEYRSVISTVDYDVEVVYCAYDDLYVWASGERKAISNEAWGIIDDIDKLDAHGWSAAMIASYHSNASCLSELIARGANINKTNYKGTTVLMFAKDGALNRGDMTCLDLLLNSGADISLRDYKGLTILDYLKTDTRQNAKVITKRLMTWKNQV